MAANISGFKVALIFTQLRNQLACCQVDCIVSSAGGVEEDFIKCMGHTYLGDFALSGKKLRMRGINRIGNLLVPNDNYCKFEDWIMPILDQMVEEQNTQVKWLPLFLEHFDVILV